MTAAAALIRRMISPATASTASPNQAGRESSSFGVLAPVRLHLVQHAVEQQRLAEADVDAAELAGAAAAARRRRPPTDSFFFGRPDELVDVGLAFQQPVVAEIGRHVGDRAARIAQEAAHRHAEHAGARAQQPAGAAAAALDEELDRVAAVHHHVHVLHEHDRVQPRAAEAAADEERAALAQQPADHRQVQVHARGDVRHGVAALVDHVGQQQVVEVAAVAGHVDDLAGRRQPVEVLGVPDLDAVVDAGQERGSGSARRCARTCASSSRRSRARGGARRSRPSRRVRFVSLISWRTAWRTARVRSTWAMIARRARQVRAQRVGAHVPEFGAHVLQQPARAARAVRRRPPYSRGSSAARRSGSACCAR